MQRLPTPQKKWPTRPQHDGRCQYQLQPVGKLLAQQHGEARQMSAHFENEHRNCENETNPEPACHVGEFRIGATVCCHRHRFQGHAANGTGAGADLPDLRMHGASVDCSRDNGLRNLLARIKILGRVRLKFGFTARAAKIVTLMMVLRNMPGGCNVNLHAADRINGTTHSWRLFIVWH